MGGRRVDAWLSVRVGCGCIDGYLDRLTVGGTDGEKNRHSVIKPQVFPCPLKVFCLEEEPNTLP